MPRGSRTLKGNKRSAVHDRLIVPENGYRMPPQVRELEPNLPDQPVGKRVWIQNVIIYEVSISYEGKPQKFIKRIPFGDIVGSPVTNEQLDRGYEFVTPQGETLLVKWHVVGNSRENQGLIVHNKRATGTSWYEPNWGQVFGVGLEWVACDGSGGGTIWANRHIGYTSVNGETVVETVTNNSNPEYAPHAVRGGLMLGNPEPDKSLWIMGQELPMRVYPSLGAIGRGCIFGFNKNVMKFLTVKPPVPPILAFTGAGTNRADALGITWRKDELHTGYTRIGMQVLSGSALIRSTSPSYPTDGSVALISSPTSSPSGGASLNTINFNSGGGQVRIRLMLLECDSSGTPQAILNCTEHLWDWVNGSGSAPYSIVECSGNLPFPVKVEEDCGSGGNPIITPPTDTDPIPSGDLSYFCDSSVSVSSISTAYWNLSNFGIQSAFWTGRNDLLDLFANSDPSTAYRSNKLTAQPFHSYLYKMIKDREDGVGAVIDADGWQAFKIWCTQEGLTCLTDLQKASMYCSYRLGVPVNFFNSAANYLSGETLTILVDFLSLLPRGIYDWIDFNDVVADSSGSVTGAFAVDIPDLAWGNFRSFVNFEPQALQYTISTAVGHRPYDYIKLPGSQWGQPSWVDWSSYDLPNMTDTNYRPFAVAEVGVHEIGHAVSYHGLDVYGQTLHERSDWLSISGWASKNSTNLSKSRAADATGGMPLTDGNKEAPVTDYGCSSPAEDFAEAYRMFIVNPVFLEQKYPHKYAFMVNVVEPMFG